MRSNLHTGFLETMPQMSWEDQQVNEIESNSEVEITISSKQIIMRSSAPHFWHIAARYVMEGAAKRRDIAASDFWMCVWISTLRKSYDIRQCFLSRIGSLCYCLRSICRKGNPSTIKNEWCEIQAPSEANLVNIIQRIGISMGRVVLRHKSFLASVRNQLESIRVSVFTINVMQ
jgi:hypothetical protein